jgi:DNA-binding CsgD family transcriptional regulator/tetratricopeptide (TPR) repeat protein
LGKLHRPDHASRSSPTPSSADRSSIASVAAASRFVGRAAELAILHEARRELTRGRGSITLIDGEAGIGKSRLVAQALRAVSGGRSSRIVQVECVQERDAELYPFRAAIERVWDADVPGATPLMQRAIAQLMPESAGIQASRGVALSRTELFAGLIAAIAAVSAKRGSILVLEDIHWADRTTLEFLAMLGTQIGAMRFMIVATSRSEAFERDASFDDVISRLLRGDGVRHVPLHPFLRTEITDLIGAAMAGGAALPPAKVAAIAERSDGNPFFAEELVKAALAQGSEELPLSIRSSIRHRLAALAPDDRAMLDIAAVLGVRFEHTMIAQLAGAAPASVLRMLREARAANIVDEVDASTFRFHHALTREAIYERLLAAETEALHRKVLGALEVEPETERTIEALAYHAWRANDREATQRYSERAGDRSLERGMFFEARSYYERMLPGADDDDVRARIAERLGTIGAALGDFAAAMSAFERALALRIERGEFSDAARVAVALAMERCNSGGDGLADLDAFFERHGSQLDDHARDRVLVFLARILTALGGFERAGALLDRVTMPNALEPRVHANFITCRLNMSVHTGDADAWRTASRDMIALGDALPPLLRSIQLTNVAQTGAWFGEATVTRNALEAAQRIAHHWGFEGIFIFSRAVEAHLEYLAGDLEAARGALDAVARRSDIAPATAIAAHIGPFVAAELGDAVLAERYLNDDAVRRVRASGNDEDALYLDAGLLVGFSDSQAPGARTRLDTRLGLLSPGTFLAPTVALVAARELSIEAAARFSNTLSTTHPAAIATRNLVCAIIASRRHENAGPFARAAAASFAALGWPAFAAAASAFGDDVALVANAKAIVTPLLTNREFEVARLVATGKTNASIAALLGVGVKTVEKHVSSILGRLGARSRAQIAAFVTESGVSISAPSERQRPAISSHGL